MLLLDYIVIAIFFAITTITALYSHYSQKNSSDKSAENYILMGRKLTLPFFIATLVSTWYGGIIGTSQIAFENGIYNFMTQGLFWYIVYAVFAIFFAKRINKLNVMSIPELIKVKIGHNSSLVTSILLTIKLLPVSAAIGIGVVSQILFGINLPLGIVLGVTFVTLYSCFGGFKTIVYTDMIQFITMFISVIIVLIASFYLYGGTSFLTSQLPSYYFQPQGTHEASHMIIWIFIALITTLTSPCFYQRCLAAKTPKIAQRGIFISIGLWFVFDISVTTGSLYARAVLPDAQSLSAYVDYGIYILPNGLKGVFVSGILATVFSTIDSSLFVASTTIYHDLLPKKYKTKLLIKQLCLIFVSLISIVAAISFEKNIEQIWILIETYTITSIFPPFMVCMLTKFHLNEKQFITSIIASIAITTICSYSFSNIALSYYCCLITSSILCLAFILYNQRVKLQHQM